MIESAWFDGGGVRLHAKVSGPVEGELLFLLHGFPEFWYGWRYQIPPLAAVGLRVIALDQRGYNLSDKPAGVAPYTVANAARDVVNVADALGRERFLVVGHDWGGVVAWRLAAQFPQRVRRFAVLNAPHPGAYRRYARSHPSQILKSAYIGAVQIPRLPEWWLARSDFRALAKTMVSSAREGTFSEGDLALYREAWAQPGALTAMLNWYRAAMRVDQPKVTHDPIEFPALVIWGERDQFLELSWRTGALAAAARPGSCALRRPRTGFSTRRRSR